MTASTFTSKQRSEFAAAVDALRQTKPGQEASMYGPLRDIFADALGYPRTDVVVDTAGARGRPDLTVFAPGAGAGTRVSWIVVEAKDERGAVAAGPRRLRLYREKAKYITADTAYIVMADPVAFVARGAGLGRHSDADIEIPWAGLTIEAFAEAMAPLRHEVAGVPAVLERFRSGDPSMIACDALAPRSGATDEERLAAQVNRDVFFDTLRETTRLLQAAVRGALAATAEERAEIKAEMDAFSAAYGGAEFTPYPISVEGRDRSGFEKDRAHRRDAALLRRSLARRPALARLALDALPRFAERTGLDPAKDAEAAKIERFFANETANLVLARILLIRFLEDHGFFDVETPDGALARRYLCNGGVQAFQGMRAYFGHGYTRLLEEAYRSGGQFYSAAFDETEMDWIIALSDAELSRTVEWAMFRMARFDFRTARGDLMSGVYDRFLDRQQRKEQGEHYTPPSIARYILGRLELPRDARVLDPACGSGTFLIERYRQIMDDDVAQGIAVYADARAAAETLFGNDLNPFSAVLTQIQLLWHLLSFGGAIRAEGFPDLRVAERANSLVPLSLHDPAQGRFGEIDQTGYDAVVGNPPYVRVERAGDLDRGARDYFGSLRTMGSQVFRGIGVSGNAYGMFMYRALDHWCRQQSADGPAGRLGFIVPLAFCVANESENLRALFRPGARWAIREIVDLELIWEHVFDADVLPMILIAEARPATAEDTVAIRLADESCLVFDEGAKRPAFDFDRLPERTVPYADLFSPDGRILTRLTPERLPIVRKLFAAARLETAAKPIWVKRAGGQQLVQDTAPAGYGASGWTKRYLVQDGAAVRGRTNILAAGGHIVFKGENVSTARLSGEPVYRNLDMSAVSTPSIWGLAAGMLPSTMYALPVIEQAPVAAPFDPARIAVLNTCVVFGPRTDLHDVPFDVVLLSRVYTWFHVVAGRRSYQNKIRGHIYSAAVRDLPWSDAVAARARDLSTLKGELLASCERRFQRTESLRAAVAAVGLVPLRSVVRARPMARLTFNEAFEEPNFTLLTGEVAQQEDGWSLSVADGSDHAVLFNDEELASFARAGLALHDGLAGSKTFILSAPVPGDATAAHRLAEIRAAHEPEALDAEIAATVDEIDAIVGGALGLAPEEIETIQDEMTSDSFLGRIRPRYPFFRPRQYGRRLNLERRNRYAAA